jgi:hypothetical protein
MVFSWPLKDSNVWISFNGHEYVIPFIAIKNYMFNGHEYAAFIGNHYVAFNGHDCIFHGKINDSLRISWPLTWSFLKGFSWGVFVGFSWAFHAFLMRFSWLYNHGVFMDN